MSGSCTEAPFVYNATNREIQESTSLLVHMQPGENFLPPVKSRFELCQSLLLHLVSFRRIQGPVEESDRTSQPKKRLSKGSALTALKDENLAAKPTRASDPDGQVKRLAKKLDLNEEQVTLIKPIFTGRAQQISAARADRSLDPKARGTRLRNIVDECDTKIAAFLDDEQKQQLLAMRARGVRR